MASNGARRAAATVVAVCAISLLAGCGGDGGSTAEDVQVVDEVSTSAAAATSGSLSLRVAIFGNDEGSDLANRVGFELLSDFDLGTGRRLPVASMTYTALRSDQVVPWDFRSTGDVAFVARDGAAYQVPEPGEGQVVALAESLHHLGDLRQWIDGPEVEDRGQVLGVSGDANGAGVLRAVFALGAALDQPNALPDPGSVSDQVLADAVESGSVSLRVSSSSHELRRLDATVIVDGGAFPEVAALVGGAKALRLEVELAVHSLPTPLTVEAPPELLPWDQLPPAAA